jgi:hypothetical protein
MTVSEWQPIETAPRDGTRVLGFDTTAFNKDQEVAVVNWWPNGDGGYWSLSVPGAGYLDSDEFAPTYWMPLPAPPIGEKK